MILRCTHSHYTAKPWVSPVFADLPDEVIEYIIKLTKPADFAKLAALRVQYNRAKQLWMKLGMHGDSNHMAELEKQMLDLITLHK